MSKIKNVLVTGGCGFIGSNLINSLLKNTRWNIYNIDKISYVSDEDFIEDRTNSKYNLLKMDLLDYDLLQQLFINIDFDLVIHLAAESHVDNSFESPLKFTQNNVIATQNILECIRTIDPSIKMIHFSTDEVVGDDNPEGESEDYYCPTNPYAASKAAAEMLCKSYIKSYKLDIIITRCNNVFGSNQFIEKVIPKFIHLIKRGKKLPIQGAGTQLRCFIHVEDVISAIVLIIKKWKKNQVYHISSDYEINILLLAKKIIEIYHPGVIFQEYIEFIPDRLYNDRRYYITSGKLEKLGWKPEKDFDEELTRLVLEL
jgi:dTDP-glucose 4,6-dehydratase